MVSVLKQTYQGPEWWIDLLKVAQGKQPSQRLYSLPWVPAPSGLVLRRPDLVSAGPPAAWMLFKHLRRRFFFPASVFRASPLNYDNAWPGAVLPASPWQLNSFQAWFQGTHFAVLSRVWSDLFCILSLKQEIWCPQEPFLTVATQGLPMSFRLVHGAPLRSVVIDSLKHRIQRLLLLDTQLAARIPSPPPVIVTLGNSP